MRVLPIFSQDDIPDTYTVIGSAISGGSFHRYLKTMMEQNQNMVCLYLRPAAHRFKLPRYDGQGEEIPVDEAQMLGTSQYTDILCCNWIYLFQPPTVILYDDANSLRKKYELAETAGIPLLAAEPAVLEKIKTP